MGIEKKVDETFLEREARIRYEEETWAKMPLGQKLGYGADALSEQDREIMREQGMSVSESGGRYDESE